MLKKVTSVLSLMEESWACQDGLYVDEATGGSWEGDESHSPPSPPKITRPPDDFIGHDTAGTPGGGAQAP